MVNNSFAIESHFRKLLHCPNLEALEQFVKSGVWKSSRILQKHLQKKYWELDPNGEKFLDFFALDTDLLVELGELSAEEQESAEIFEALANLEVDKELVDTEGAKAAIQSGQWHLLPTVDPPDFS